MALTGAGVVIGLAAAALGLTGVLKSLLFGDHSVGVQAFRPAPPKPRAPPL